MGVSPDFLATLGQQTEPWRGYQKVGDVPEYGMEQVGAVEVQAVVRSAMPMVDRADTDVNGGLYDLWVYGKGVPGATIIVVVPACPAFNGSTMVDADGDWDYDDHTGDYTSTIDLKGATVTVTQIEPGKGESGPVYKVVVEA